MEPDDMAESTLACDLTRMDVNQRARHQIVMQDLQALVQEVQELPDGFAFRYPADARSCLLVAEFVSLERLCCPFFAFTLDVAPHDGPIWLRITGREGVKQFLLAEMGMA